MNDLTEYNLPLPSGEKWAGRIIKALLLLIGGTAAYGIFPFVITLLGGILTIGNLLLKIGAIATIGIVLLLFINAMAPAVKNFISVSGYKVMDFLVDNYPMEQMQIWKNILLNSKEETEKSQRVLMGIYEDNENKIEELSKEIKSIEEAFKTADLNQKERDQLTSDLSGLLSEKEILESVSEKLKEPIEIIGVFVEYKEKVLKAYEITMRTTMAHNSAQETLNKANSILANVFGNSKEKQNAIAARELILKKFGTELGELKGFQMQMSKLIEAGNLGDKIALANARNYINSRMNVIEGTATVVKTDSKLLLS